MSSACSSASFPGNWCECSSTTLPYISTFTFTFTTMIDFCIKDVSQLQLYGTSPTRYTYTHQSNSSNHQQHHGWPWLSPSSRRLVTSPAAPPCKGSLFVRVLSIYRASAGFTAVSKTHECVHSRMHHQDKMSDRGKDESSASMAYVDLRRVIQDTADFFAQCGRPNAR